MALPILALIEAVTAAGTIIEKLVSKSEQIGGWGRNKEVKAQLGKDVADLRTALRNGGKLAEAGEAYSESLEDFTKLLVLCQRALSLLKDHSYDLVDPNDEDYAVTWRSIDMLVESIDRERGPIISIALNRKKWFDQQDEGQIDLLAHQFGSSFVKARLRVEQKMASEAEDDFDAMVEQLLTVEQAIRGTLYGKILPALKGLGTPAEP